MTLAKGALMYGFNQPLVIEELEWNDPGPDEIGVRILASGVCHTDYHAVTGEYAMEFPSILGHEGVGIVEKVGERCKRIKEGDHVMAQASYHENMPFKWIAFSVRILSENEKAVYLKQLFSQNSNSASVPESATEQRLLDDTHDK